MNRVSYILIILFILTACTSSPSRPAKVSYFEVVGDQTRRVEIVTNMITQFHPPPTPLVDAQFVEEKIGDNELGPADYRAFAMLAVEAGDLAAWQDILVPLDSTPSYSAPFHPYSWWIDQANFTSLEFYAPETLTGRANGWIAIDHEQATIYLYSFTT